MNISPGGSRTRIVSWNVRQGGAGRFERLAGAVADQDADLAVLVECRGRHSPMLLESFRAAGYVHQHAAAGDPVSGRVVIVSRLAMEPVEPSAPDLAMPARWAEVLVRPRRLRVAGVYVPVTGREPERKARMFESVRKAAVRRLREPYVIIGDWNTGDHPLDKSHPGRPFRFTQQYRDILSTGYVEAWRHFHPEAKEFSWYGRGRGFRIDHAFVSPPLLDRVAGCWYSHQEREAGVSDHSMLILDVVYS